MFGNLLKMVLGAAPKYAEALKGQAPQSAGGPGGAGLWDAGGPGATPPRYIRRVLGAAQLGGSPRFS